MYNHHHVIWGCIQPSGVTPESLVLVLPWDLNAVQLQEIMKWCKHDKHGMERYIIYKSIISSKLCFMDMEPIWKAGDFYIYSIPILALSAGSLKIGGAHTNFLVKQKPLQLLTRDWSLCRRTWPNTRTPFPYSPALYFRNKMASVLGQSWCTKLENCAIYFELLENISLCIRDDLWVAEIKSSPSPI